MHRSLEILLFVLVANLLSVGILKAEIPAIDFWGEGESDLVNPLGVAEFSLLAEGQDEVGPSVVINEIHYNPDVKTELVEFIELHNPGSIDINIAGWYLSDGIAYQFPADAVLQTGGYIIVAQNPADVQDKWKAIPQSRVFGPFNGSLNNDGEKIELCNANGEEIDKVDYQLGFPWPTVGDAVPDDGLHPGTGHSIQLVNPGFDNDLAGSWRSALPTPGAKNTEVYATNIPPHIRQVNHSPKEPKSGEVVTITAKVTDPNEVVSVTLYYQLVNPGSYIPITLPNQTITNPAYETNWTGVDMHDDGLNGDLVAGDDIYTVQMPASLQTHRRIIRYRITAQDSTALSVRVPYADDFQPNFAYFVYDGVPAWHGAIKPGDPGPEGEVVEYNTEVLTSLPIFHVISRGSDIYSCHREYIPFGQETDFIYAATVVYDGEVYDHVFYRAKGFYSYIIEGKRKWKFNFHRGHRLQMRDDYGNELNERWDQINLSTGTCPYWREFGWDEGVDGMVINEATAFRFFSLSGVPACNTAFLHVRVIDNSSENGADQYSGDFWGLYIGVEEVDTRFINERDLPDGNLYKRAGNNIGVNQGPTEPDVASHTDVDNLVWTIDSHPSMSWWENNVNLPCYYGYHTASIVLNNSDQTWDRNSYLYHNPVTNKWSMLPWDVDLVYEYASHYDDNEHFKYVLEHPEANIDFKNHARELQDLLFNGEQASQLIGEIASIVSNPTTTLKFVEANRARWEYDPYVVARGRDDLFYISSWWAPDYDFATVIQYMKDYISPAGVGSNYGGGRLTVVIRDSDIPNTPTITYTGSEGFPADGIAFETSSFSDPQGNSTFAAMKWRLAEVELGSEILSPAETGLFPGTQGKYEINAVWESDEISPYRRSITLPVGVSKVGHTYRVRCRMKDNTGRWGHWSNPIQFVAGEPLTDGISSDLRITELMYNPTKAKTASGELAVDNEDFEFIELKNVGFKAINLNQIKFSDGIDFTFSSFELGAGEYVVIVRDRNAFESRYGSGINIAGEYSGRLDNDGERIRLENAFGQIILDFRYEDNWYDTTDGQGFSLTIVDTTNPDIDSWGQQDSWRASVYPGGSPCRDDSVDTPGGGL